MRPLPGKIFHRQAASGMRRLSQITAPRLWALGFALLLAACGPASPQAGPSPTGGRQIEKNTDTVRDDPAAPGHSAVGSTAEPDESEVDEMGISITVGDSVFSGIFYDNEAVEALLAQFPLTLDMSDLHKNEKYCYLPEILPAASTEAPDTIHAGEIMCWSGNCLVLFYDTFSNTYGGYVRLGHIEDGSGLAEALGNRDVSVTFDRAENG